MDSSMHSTPASSSRKRPREGETESQRAKREKAAERQRRKRERDRNSGGGLLMNSFTSQSSDHHHHQQHLAHQQHQQQQHQQQQPQQQMPVPIPQPALDYRSTSNDFQPAPPDLSPEEAARRDRVRAAARERQRKHRMLVKQRKMRDLGLDMGNEILPGMDEVHFRVNADGQYQQVLPHELPQQQPPPPNMGGPHEPPFPQGQPLGGQTFASTLLLSFSCAPLLKQHLLRTLHMTNEELASLEPILAEAWERWDHARRAHYAEQAVKAGLPPPAIGPYLELTHEQQQAAAQAAAQAVAAQQQQNPPSVAYSVSIPTNGPGDTTTHPTPNEFRARFHRPLVAPSPFQALPGDSSVSANNTNNNSANGTGKKGKGKNKNTGGVPAIDPHLGNGGGPAGGINGSSSVGGGPKDEGSPDSGASYGGDDPDFG